MKFKSLILLFLLVAACKKQNTELPVLSYNYLDGKKVPYTIDTFKFINQDGDTITGESTKGKVHTINFFFTTCPSICPPMRLKQQDIMETFSGEDSFKQYSISIDFKRDSIEQLQYYSKLHGINSAQWHLLRASSEAELEEMATLLKTNFKPNEDGTDFYHSSYVALIDKKQFIRGFYDILKVEEVALLKQDIEHLLSQ
ncbi:SCO family protein [Psychroserpens sp. MEBiC05023]